MINNYENSTFRIVTMGDESVGKTSIIRRIVEKKFNQYESNTIGADFTECTQYVDGRMVVLQIWDTAGQEKFKSVCPIYFRNTDGAVLVFSLVNTDSFKNISSWIKYFMSIETSARIYLIANKSDLIDDYEVTIKEATEWADINKYPIFITSAKTNSGISEAISFICNDLMSQNHHSIKKTDTSFILKEAESDKCC
ncbi:putative Ras-related protein Rab-33 [Tritrichomonas foetus]|uniref:Ras-related protein Rab-33 n=1 Tax=Tritrichomonas foetus TaxID=1144522 RepID=A0A1J4KPR4_9EUKA|nr:putative Ras-related protein Rab-33 [Tritrichomonas foetus]|eukprot:OHT11694.1 putative Ras-related protein Rab-33 [Tritrichomonas foetus]